MGTAPGCSQVSQSVTVTHPYHPRRGQRFTVLKRRRVAGAETFLVRSESGENLSLLREWTDLADPSEIAAGETPRILDARRLLVLSELVARLLSKSSSKTSRKKVSKRA
jgi:hypothetical protein